jgi:hypothetical protein
VLSTRHQHCSFFFPPTKTHRHTFQGQLHHQVGPVAALHHLRAGPLRRVRASAQER